MQTVILKKMLRANSGSALVGVVVFSSILAIAAAGLMGASRNTVNLEVDAHNDARAYLAAEAGLLMATHHRWNNDWGRPGNTAPITLTHDGIGVTVTIAVPDEGPVSIVSRAVVDELGYDKELEWQAQGNPPASGGRAVSIDQGTGSVAFRRTTVFDGPIHFNTSLFLDNSDFPVFLNRVTLNNTSPPRTGNYGVGPRDGNNYMTGLEIRNEFPGGPGRANSLDGVFRNSYQVVNRIYITTFTTESQVDGSVTRWQNLPVPAGASFADNSFLKFGVDGSASSPTSMTAATNITTPCPTGTSCYTFFQQTESNLWVPFFQTIPNDRELIINADFGALPLNVRDGIMNGRVTVRASRDIVFNFRGNQTTTNPNFPTATAAGNVFLTYDNYTLPTSPSLPNRDNAVAADAYANAHRAGNFGIGTERTDILAFYSANGDIRFNFNSNNERNRRHIITAQMLAPSGTIIPPSTSHINDGSINIYGALSSRYWWDQTNNMSNEGLIRVFHDTRMLNAPGVIVLVCEADNPSVCVDMGDGGEGGSGGSNRLLTNWAERNCARGQPCS
ncbi:MAG: hypothetical protein LBC70_03805 [Chitinispirillales bacterium]|jgi:hypothetical protein|nr:hypothetical protein [Chitinispirillales bacterium]